MRTLGDLLASRRRRCFVGRDAELELVRDALGADEPPFAVLWFTGPGGIGKSSLLEVGDLTVARLDGRHVAPSPRAVLDPLGATITAGRTVLLIDAYERLDAIDDRVRNRLLPRLPETALTVVAGRHPPGPAWRADPAWRELLRVVALRNLSQEAAAEVLGLPFSTYRRHLSRGVQRVTAWLWERELY